MKEAQLQAACVELLDVYERHSRITFVGRRSGLC